MDQTPAETHRQEKPKTRRVRRHAPAAMLAIAVLIAAVFVARRQPVKGDEADEPAVAPSDVMIATPEQLKEIRVEPAREQLIDSDLETTGKVGFNEDLVAPVFSPYAGRVLEVLANRGDVVKAGQPDLVIESPDLIAAVNDLAEARSNVDKGKIALDAADKAAQRARRLHEQEAISTKDLQSAEAELARSQEEYRHAVTAVSVVHNRLALFGKSDDEISALESVTDQIDRRITIRAPIGGTVVDRKVGPGQYIKPDAPDPLFLVSDLSTVWVNADVYESYLPQIRPGAPVEITVASYPDRKFPARIASINPTVDPATRTIHVRCLVSNEGGLFKPEMFANVRIGKAVQRKATTVPTTAVLSEGAQAFVVLEESPGKFRRHNVKSGTESHGVAVVEEGLRDGDRVVTSGALLLNNGLGK